jgi:phenylalanyl-tRNA synthetase beta chain
LLIDLALFDVYRGKGVSEDSRSLAYRLRLQAPDRTLTDVEVSDVRAKCIAAAKKLGATLRG